jgi:hypothetical protein
MSYSINLLLAIYINDLDLFTTLTTKKQEQLPIDKTDTTKTEEIIIEIERKNSRITYNDERNERFNRKNQ